MDSRTHPTDRDKGNGVELTTEQARAGATPHMTRYILGWGLALVIIAFLIVLAANNWG
ncbi:hypothetical protein Swit_4564 [Rhizorhabdus wittichii RW1]|jgi:hypothetical protein|uniref:Uncharacterized protein n=2 Tax=Rhizorhabdus wittichii TaxID=160791 RepID=A0A9J9HG68_RHIWR|nr:hypothetical protein [Rhizorhabdus wittichii]ABQ70902.1 hypothetical protein Swit_4564 [Rhizorhabdus wittichii RW1]QTH23616.1 hypothetical protein HRJ34_09005 [Rhizorhabdus wittichii]